MKNYAVIVAGGSGSRMQAHQPKQFMELAGRPVLMHTLDAFANSGLEIELILVLPTNHMDTWKRLIEQHRYAVPHEIATGGATRFDSVKSGLNKIQSDGIVAIHDGARPLVSTEVIQRTFQQAQKTGNGIATVRVKDSIRQMVAGQSKAVDRNYFYAVQTPQTFKIDLLKQAFVASESNSFTDDASVIEAFGEKVELVEGSYDNLKITTPEDLIIAAALLESAKKNA